MRFSSSLGVASVVLLASLLAGGEALGIGKWAKPFSEAEVLVEINATDGDAGFQGKIDGDPWTSASLRGPSWTNLFSFRLIGDAALQGFTEFVWESAEPTFDEFGLDEFLERFPEGPYRFKAREVEGGLLRSTAQLTHDLPAGPNITSPEEGEGVPSGEDVVVTWDAVTTEFGLGDPYGEATPDLESDIVQYIVVAEYEDEDEDIKEVMTIEIAVPEGDDSETWSATIPGSFLKFSDSEGYKMEVGAVEESGNRTFIEVPFCTDMDCPDEEEDE